MEEKTNEKKTQNPLLIFCFDSAVVCDKVTFLSYLFQGLNVTYWHEDTENEKERVDGLFELLFKEVLKRRENKINLQLK